MSKTAGYLSGNDFRAREYEPYRPYRDLARELKTSSYNQYENPTGIYVEADEDITVFVADTKGEAISLVCRNWDDNKEEGYPLRTGVNQITPSISGNTYINYFTPDYKTAEPIQVHIQGGKVNGVFLRDKHTNEDWKELLKNASSPYLDIVGKYVSLAFYVPELKKSCPDDGVRLIEVYDEIIEHQYDLMGFFKYDRVPKNHMFGRNMQRGYMHADGIGAAFQHRTMENIGDPEKIVRGGDSWGIAHEFGHVNQIRPGLRWIGTVECTNNIYSSYTQYTLQKKYSTLDLRLEHEACIDIKDGIRVIGGRVNSHLHYGVLEGDHWLYQWGQDGPSDHFVKLVPLWQLNLYFRIAEGTSWRKPDWYGDICEEVIKQDDSGLSNGDHQINFMKRACQFTETDLTEFFETAGLLKPIDIDIDDYGTQTLTITEEMCQEVRDFVARHPEWKKPEGAINYISGNTVGIYEKRLDVKGGTVNEGVSGTETSRTVNHDVWKNAVVYKTYAGEEVVRLTMAGTGTKDNSSTLVPYPEGATTITAVSWKGEETVVYQL